MSQLSSEAVKELTQIVCEQVRQSMQQQLQEQFAEVQQETRSTQRAQTSLAEADHYSHIAHCKNVEPWL